MLQAFSFYRIYISMLFALFAFLFLYLYFVFASIYYTSLAKNTQLQLSNINSDIAAMEAKYVKAYEAVNSSFASDNFIKLAEKEKKFVKKDTYLGRAN